MNMEFPASVDTQAYWDGLAAGRLLVQCCSNCGQWRHYPRPMCSGCHSFDHDWREVSGHGVVHSWTVTHQSPLPGFKDAVPFVLVTVDMAEGVRMLGLLQGTPAEALRVGLAVQASVATVPGGARQPVFSVR
jgi:uncharacterized OB-fold protein